MKVLTNQDTIDAIKEVVKQQPDFPGTVRLYLAGMGCSGPSFGLSLDEAKETDLVDDSNEIVFIMDKDLFDQVGEMKVEFLGNGYQVIPVNQPESSCGSCSGCGGH
jgi:Fe-S cluster assembly iron-binding protein IscA